MHVTVVSRWDSEKAMKQRVWNSPLLKNANNQSSKQATLPCSQTKKKTQNLQVIKFLQRYIWCEHIQYSNDLKIGEGREKKTWINTALTQIPEPCSKWRNMIKSFFIMRQTTGIKMAERIPESVPSNVRICYVSFYNSEG